ncbi:MAG: hypothetical protein M8467_01075 [Anaerolineae bacterium]|nr:hypothetical protein [Anaerolineae bacterium]
MQTAKCLAAVLLLSVLVGCGTGEIGIQQEPLGEPGAGSATEAAQPAASPAEASTGSAEPPRSPEPSPTATDEPPATGEVYTFDPQNWQESLSALTSFRQKAVLQFTSEDRTTSRATYEGRVTAEPKALHSLLWIEGRGTGQLPTNQVEVIWIGDKVWVKAGRQPWIQVPASAVEKQFSGEVVGVEDLLPRIRAAHRAQPDETVNGIPCNHYVYDTGSLEAEAGMVEAQGDVWVAQDSGYVVRLTMRGQGTYYGIYGSSGTLDLVYDLYDANAPMNIAPPR